MHSRSSLRDCSEISNENRFTFALVSADRRIPSSPCKTFTVSERNVLAIRTLKLFGKPEVDDVDLVLRRLSAPNEEIIWLDVSMDDPFLVTCLNQLNLNWWYIQGVPTAQLLRERF